MHSLHGIVLLPLVNTTITRFIFAEAFVRRREIVTFATLSGSNGGIGRHEGLKIPWPVMAVRVQVPLRVQSKTPCCFTTKQQGVFIFPKALTGLPLTVKRENFPYDCPLLIAYGETFAMMFFLFHFIDHGNCVIFNRDMTLAVFINNQIILSKAKFSRSLPRFESSGRRKEHLVCFLFIAQSVEIELTQRFHTAHYFCRNCTRIHNSQTGSAEQCARTTNTQQAFDACLFHGF